jgi:hypothetical protein
VSLSFRDDILNELVGFHKIKHTDLLFRAIKLVPCFLEFLSVVDELVGLNKRLLAVILIYIKTFPFLNNFTREFSCFLFAEYLLFERFSIFTPSLLRVL